MTDNKDNPRALTKEDSAILCDLIGTHGTDSEIANRASAIVSTLLADSRDYEIMFERERWEPLPEY